ncbi:MAG: hypothetical protein CMF50_05745 [Legionellales bacterium]|nr:hypothetical protein [Legionellales bacterium]
MTKKDYDHETMMFLLLIGAFGLVFGAIIALFDLTNSPVLSAIASIISISIGCICCLIAASLYLKTIEDLPGS